MSKVATMLHPDRKRLFLRGCTVETSLNEINPEEISELRFGEFPAIEALAFAVIGADKLVETAQFDYHYPGFYRKEDDEGVTDLLAV